LANGYDGDQCYACRNTIEKAGAEVILDLGAKKDHHPNDQEN
jgi:hypothetical protein